MLGELIVALTARGEGPIVAAKTAPVGADLPNIQALGNLLYTRYLYIFEGAGLVLLVAMIGAIVLTHRRRTDRRPQDASRQIARRPEDSVRNMDPKSGEGVTL